MRVCVVRVFFVTVLSFSGISINVNRPIVGLGHDESIWVGTNLRALHQFNFNVCAYLPRDSLIT